MSDMSGVVINAEAEDFNITPFGQARMSNGLFHCAETCRKDDPVLLKYLLYCLSIEFGLKAAILSIDGSEKKEKELKSISHNLVDVYEEFCLAFPGPRILDAADLKVLERISPHFAGKGLEYITDVKREILRAYKDFPTIEDMQTVSGKINKILIRNKFFMRG